MSENDKGCREACSLAVIEHLGLAALSDRQMSILEAFEIGFHAAWNRRSQPEWVSVDERLPECSKGVLLAGANFVRAGWLRDPKYIGKKAEPFDSHLGVVRNVTHWMPLPAAPQPPIAGND